MLRLLVIDDDPLFGSTLVRLGMMQGITVDYCESLLDAMYGHYLQDYDAAVVDCMMPEMSGFEVAHYLDTFLRGLPVLLVSASDQAQLRFGQSHCGTKVFIAKNLGSAAILMAATTLAHQHNQAGTLPRRSHIGRIPCTPIRTLRK